MNKLQMAVFKYSGVGAAKTWCLAQTGNGYLVRYSENDETLRERVLDINSSEANQRIQAKVKAGFVLQGNYMVSGVVEEKVAESVMNQSQIQATDLAMWVASSPSEKWAEASAEMLKNLFTDVSIHKVRNGINLLLIPSIEFRFEFDANGKSRGVIGRSEVDAKKMVALMAIAKQTNVIIVDDDGKEVSTRHFRSGAKHLKFMSTSFTDFESMLVTAKVVRSDISANMSGATAFI